MKSIFKITSIVFLLLMVNTSKAQFNHEFSGSTTINPFSLGWFGDPGCFLSLPNYLYVYSAVDGGIIAVNTEMYVYLPVLNFQGSFEVKIEYSSSTAFNCGSNMHDGVSWMGYSEVTLPGTIGNSTATHTIRTGSLNGVFRPSFYIYDLGVTVHSVIVTNVSYSPGQGCSVLNNPLCSDVDSDGVCDSSDDYPNDPTKAYSTTVPATTFMYEDLYPAYGDFDFNDLVVNTSREIITDADNTLRYLVVEAEVKASGASIAQGWGLELKGINPSDVIGVSGSNTASGVMSLGANGTEHGQTNAVVPIFDNANQVINRAGGPFFNTVSTDPAGTGETIEVVIEFDKNSDLTVNDLDYNFFAFRTNSRGHEIHEIGNTPTSLANQALFGTGMDDTDVNSNQYYVSVDGFPWAISSVGTDYAIEKIDMVEAFLKFAGWAQSGGTMYQDWHTNTAEGTYRNSAKIY